MKYVSTDGDFSFLISAFFSGLIVSILKNGDLRMGLTYAIPYMIISSIVTLVLFILSERVFQSMFQFAV